MSVDPNSWRARLYAFLATPGLTWMWIAALLCGFRMRFWWSDGEPDEQPDFTEDDLIDYRAGVLDALTMVAHRLERESPADPVSLVRAMIQERAT